MRLIAVTARICALYRDFSARSDTRLQRLVATASGPALIISRVVSCGASGLGCGARFGWLMLAFDRVPMDCHG